LVPGRAARDLLSRWRSASSRATEAPPAATASLALPNYAAAPPWPAARFSAPTPAASTTVDAGRSDGGVVASDAGSTVDQCPDRLPPPTIPWSSDPWVPSAISDPVELFNAARSGMPGRWEGLATTPWVGSYRVEIAAMVGVTLNGAPMLFPVGPAEIRSSLAESLEKLAIVLDDVFRRADADAGTFCRSVGPLRVGRDGLGALVEYSSRDVCRSGPVSLEGGVLASALARIDPGLLARIDPHGREAVHRRIIGGMSLSTCMLASEQLSCVE
jgi:hypothetical protein